MRLLSSQGAHICVNMQSALAMSVQACVVTERGFCKQCMFAEHRSGNMQILQCWPTPTLVTTQQTANPYLATAQCMLNTLSQTLKRKFMMSPSWTMYSLPSSRSLPKERRIEV